MEIKTCSLGKLVGQYKSGDLIKLKIYHKGETKTADVLLEERK